MRGGGRRQEAAADGRPRFLRSETPASQMADVLLRSDGVTKRDGGLPGAGARLVLVALAAATSCGDGTHASAVGSPDASGNGGSDAAGSPAPDSSTDSSYGSGSAPGDTGAASLDAPDDQPSASDSESGQDSGTGTAPTCAQNTPSPNDARPGECDYLLQSLDFEDSFGYASPPGSIKVTSYGQAFGRFAVNACSPYCYAKNLTVGVDIVGGGSPAQLQGEIILSFPTTGPNLPIAAADATRNGLAWITFDGAAKPGFEIDTQLVLETAAGIVPAVENKAFFKPGGNLAPFGPFNVTNNYSYANGCEFKYFPMTGATGFPSAPANVTGIGFRITAKAAAGQEWHGVAYIDHAQIRAAGADNPADAGPYPYGL